MQIIKSCLCESELQRCPVCACALLCVNSSAHFADAKSTYCGARKSTGSRFAMAVCMQRPSSVKLASVKHELYHPLLPTLRKMDMDEVARRLPDEHSRTTTQCTRGESHRALDSVQCKIMKTIALSATFNLTSNVQRFTPDMFASARSTLHFPKKRLHCKVRHVCKSGLAKCFSQQIQHAQG